MIAWIAAIVVMAPAMLVVPSTGIRNGEAPVRERTLKDSS
jgi:hypothetical protein